MHGGLGTLALVPSASSAPLAATRRRRSNGLHEPPHPASTTLPVFGSIFLPLTNPVVGSVPFGLRNSKM